MHLSIPYKLVEATTDTINSFGNLCMQILPTGVSMCLVFQTTINNLFVSKSGVVKVRILTFFQLLDIYVLM